MQTTTIDKKLALGRSAIIGFSAIALSVVPLQIDGMLVLAELVSYQLW